MVLRFLVLFVLVAGSSVVMGAPTYRGMSYTSWGTDALSQPNSDLSLAKMRQVGVDMVSINVWEFQDNESSTEIAHDYSRYSSSESSIRHAIQKAHALGMKVLLKPNVDLRNGVWRYNIEPSKAWFEAYRSFIRKYARIAQEEGVEMLSIGTEFGLAETWSDSWRNVAAEARIVFSGKLTYAANHGSEQGIAWWDAVDLIGIDAYYPLSYNSDPTLAELRDAWRNRANSIETWLGSTGLDRKILFTEVGYRSAKGAAAAPWDYSTNMPVDLTLQANCYEALLGELTNRSWFDGAMWWNWETHPDAGGLLDSGFTPQNKPAEEVLRHYYKPVPEPASVFMLAAGTILLMRKKRI